MILTHTGRALTAEHQECDGKWWTFPGFTKSRELYNLDLAILDDQAVEQAVGCGHVLVVEGCFDVAKLYAAGIRNVVATFGADLSPQQIRRLDLIAELTGVQRFLFFYDRDAAGRKGTEKALAALSGDSRAVAKAGYSPWVEELVSSGELEADTFDWERTNWKRPGSPPRRRQVPIPAEITDPGEFSVAQLRWRLHRCQGKIVTNDIERRW